MLKNITRTALLFSLGLTLAAHAEDVAQANTKPRPQEMTFEQLKSMSLQRTDEQIQRLTQFKQCLNAASTKEAVIECHKAWGPRMLRNKGEQKHPEPPMNVQ